MTAIADSSPTLSISVRDTLAATIAVRDAQVQFPNVPSKQWLPLAALNYGGELDTTNVPPPTDLSIIEDQFSIVIGENPGSQLRSHGDNETLVLHYSIFSHFVYYGAINWLDYARHNSLDPESAFFHCAGSPYAISNSTTSFGENGFPVSWWWDARLIASSGGGAIGGGPITPLFDASPGTFIGGVATHFTDGSTLHPPLGQNTGDAIYLGMPDKFDEINPTPHAAPGSGWTFELEYCNDAHTDGTPHTWATLTRLSDTSSNFTTTGTIRFTPPSDWAPCSMVDISINTSTASDCGLFLDTYQGNPAAHEGTAKRGYYIRIRTTAGNGSNAPTMTRLGCADFTGQGDTCAAGPGANAIPMFDYEADLDGDGYLNETEWGTKRATYDARFVHHSRMITYGGTNNFTANPRSSDFRQWVVDYYTGVGPYSLTLNPDLDGFFCDQSTVFNYYSPGLTVENNTDLAPSYIGIVRALWQAMPDSARGPRFVIPNCGPSYYNPTMIAGCPSFYSENVFTDELSWMDFETQAGHIATVQAAIQPPIGIIDYVSMQAQNIHGLTTIGDPSINGGSGLTSEQQNQIQMLGIGLFCMLKTTNLYLCFLSHNTTGSDYNPNRWCPALSLDLGAASGDFTTFISCTGGGYTYKVYQRIFANGMVLYKPRSVLATAPYTVGPIGVPGDATATTHSLGGTYNLLSADGTTTPVMSVSLSNGEAAVLLN